MAVRRQLPKSSAFASGHALEAAQALEVLGLHDGDDPASGSAIAVSRAISPGWFIPISMTAATCAGSEAGRA